MNIALLNHYEEKNNGYYCNIVMRAKLANLRDIITTIKKSNIFNKIILQTNDLSITKGLDGLEIQNTSNISNFGKRLNLILCKYPNCKLFYSGSGSSAFLRPQDIIKYLKELKNNSIIANNLYSTDYFFLGSTNKRFEIDNIKADNSIPKFLIEKYGLYGIEIKRNEFSLFDIDGPLDLLSLKISGKGGRNLKLYLDKIELSNQNLIPAIDNFTIREKEILLWGRISEFLIQFLRYRTACRTKFVVEGRGLVSQGEGDFYSIFFDALLKLGKRFLLKNISKYCDALFIDSRILFAHLKMEIKKEDRFALDMLDLSRIKNRKVKNLCKMAIESKIPVIFCNHSFLNSGIPILVDYAWRMKGFKSSKYGNGIVKEIIK